MEVRDNANNSVFARRFVLYDKESTVTTSGVGNKGIHVTSAASDTDFRWQNNLNSKTLRLRLF